jgi:cytochrome P450
MNAAVQMSPKAPQPAHVPDSVVYDFDAYRDPELLADAFKRIARMVREAPPIFWTPRNGGHWLICGYEPLFNAYRDFETFTSQYTPSANFDIRSLLPPGSPRIPSARPINLDPPDHTKWRAPLQKTFSPKSALAMRDDIRKLANELIDAVADQGHCDWMPAVADQLPVRVFIKMFGLPIERHQEYRQLAKEHLAGIAQDPVEMVKKSLKLVAVMRDTILERRDHPRDDILSMLWQTTVDGKPTTIEDMEDYAVLLFIAGLDTVVNGMGITMKHLATDQALQDELRANPKNIPEAVEEMLRRYSFTVPVRHAAKDAVFEGIQFKKGERVLMYDPAADIDPSKFKEPLTCDWRREEKTHIAFGGGPHRCLGAHLARIELQIITEVALSRLRNIRLDPHTPPRYHGGHVIGPESLSVIWDV